MIRFSIALLAALVVLTACEGRPDAAGRYTLIRTGAGELPALLGQRDDCRYEVIAGSVDLKADNSYEAQLHRTERCDVLVAQVDTIVDEGRGRFETLGDSIRFIYEHGPTAGMGLLSGDTLTVMGPGQTLIYRKDGGR